VLDGIRFSIFLNLSDLEEELEALQSSHLAQEKTEDFWRSGCKEDYLPFPASEDRDLFRACEDVIS